MDDDIRATHTRRDAPLWEEEVVELFLDPWGADAIYVEIEVSPANVVFDALIVNRARDGELARDLDALRGWRCHGLRTAARVDGVLNGGPVSRGWEVEIAIPMRQLAPQPPAGARRRVALQRLPRRSVGARRRAAGLLAHRPTGLSRPGAVRLLQFA